MKKRLITVLSIIAISVSIIACSDGNAGAEYGKAALEELKEIEAQENLEEQKAEEDQSSEDEAKSEESSETTQGAAQVADNSDMQEQQEDEKEQPQETLETVETEAPAQPEIQLPAGNESYIKLLKSMGPASGTLSTIDGLNVGPEVFAGSEVTLINFWGTFCGPCIREMPALGEIARERAGQVQIIGVIVDCGSPEEYTFYDAVNIINSTGASYTHAFASGTLAGRYLQYIDAVPTSIFVDEGGNVLYAHVGSLSKDDLNYIIDGVIQLKNR